MGWLYQRWSKIMTDTRAETIALSEPLDDKLVYIKPLRTLVRVQTMYADQVRDLCNAPAAPSEPVLDRIKEALFKASDNAVIAHNTVYLLEPYLKRALSAQPDTTKSAPALWASQNTAERDPSVMPDCAGAGTSETKGGAK